ncbi:MAG: hypothetical protein MHPSP_001550, partial [Paramarteilia canceri]
NLITISGRTISFSGSCFQCPYQFGAGLSLKTYSNLMNDVQAIGGTSAGAVIAVCMLIDTIEWCNNYFKTLKII